MKTTKPKANTLRIPHVFMPLVIAAIERHGTRRQPLELRDAPSQNVWLPGPIYQALKPAVEKYRQREAELRALADAEARAEAIPKLEAALKLSP